VSPTTEERREEVRERLAALLRQNGPLDIVEAALLVAAEEYPHLDTGRERRRIEALAAEAGSRALPLANPFARLDALRVYLFDELGFHGSVDDYDDPRNSFLNKVLDRRAGIPLTLSLVFMEVARGAGFEARGVGLPGHFVVRLDHDGRVLIVDPYHAGAVITEEDCRDLVLRSTGRPSLFRRELLEGTTPLAMLVRLLRNLKRVFLAREDYERALGVVDRLLLAAPGEPSELRDRGFVLAHLGRPGAAAADLESYLSLAPGAPDADAVRDRLAWLNRKNQEIN
jgi:regulator of sirC expression with transglutaminase-like and TPR domain